MGKIITIRNLRLGDGTPKICVPFAGETLPELLEQAVLIKNSRAALAEWRADSFSGLTQADALPQALHALRATLGELPLLFTIRTLAEGGNAKLPRPVYVDRLKAALDTGDCALVDVELSAGESACRAVLEAARIRAVPVVVSRHHFTSTPPLSALLNTLRSMRALGADIPKLAVMPSTPEDVLTLLSATEQFCRESDCPVITMSMGQLGSISRVAGAFFGSAVTFGALSQASAPGQLPVATLDAVLQALSFGSA